MATLAQVQTCNFSSAEFSANEPNATSQLGPTHSISEYICKPMHFKNFPQISSLHKFAMVLLWLLPCTARFSFKYRCHHQWKKWKKKNTKQCSGFECKLYNVGMEKVWENHCKVAEPSTINKVCAKSSIETDSFLSFAASYLICRHSLRSSFFC